MYLPILSPACFFHSLSVLYWLHLKFLLRTHSREFFFILLPQTVCRVALKLPMTIFANKVPFKFVIRHAKVQLTVTIATIMFEILSRESCGLPMIFGFSSILSSPHRMYRFLSFSISNLISFTHPSQTPSSRYSLCCFKIHGIPYGDSNHKIHIRISLYC